MSTDWVCNKSLEEDQYSLVGNKSGSRSNHSQRKKSTIPSLRAEPMLETRNSFEILHNLNEEGPHDALARNNLSSQLLANNSHRSNKLWLDKKASDGISVITKGCTPFEGKKITGLNCKVKGSAQLNKQRRIVIIGDSHVRGCAANMKHILRDSFLVQGIVKRVQAQKL
jgi:hypothetical protein